MRNIYLKICTLFMFLFYTQILLGQNNIASFGPQLSFVNVNETDVPTSPEPLTIELDSPAIGDLVITIISDNSSALTVTGGGVTIQDGEKSAEVLVKGLSQSNAVTLTAVLNAQTLEANVRVVGISEVAQLSELYTSKDTIVSGDSTSIYAVLDIPAEPGGAVINLSLSPASAGTIPSSIIIPEGQVKGAFEYEDANSVSTCTITAAYGGSSLETKINMVASLAIETPENPLTFTVFPNPFTNQFTITHPSNQESTILIYNSLSQLVFQQKFSNVLTIDVTNLKEGLYIYSVKNSNERILKSGKLFKYN